MAKKNTAPIIKQFITQEDIDRVLDAAFDEQAEAEGELELGDGDLASDSDPFDFDDDDEIGLISEDEIQALLKGDSSFNAPISPVSGLDLAPPAVSAESEGMIAQSDIDALLSGAMDAAVQEEPDASQPDSSGAAGMDADGSVSQDDIDALLREASGDAPAPSTAEEESGSLISQSDIDALLQGASSDEPPDGAVAAEGEDDQAADGLVSQSDIDALLRGASSDEPPDAAMAAEGEDDQAADGLISQSDIDALLRESSQDGEPSEASAQEEALGEGFGSFDESSGLISQGDIDALLNDELGASGSAGVLDPPAPDSDWPASPQDALGADGEDSNEAFVAQEPDESGDHVSQADIDALLMEAMESDGSAEEDVHGEVDADIHERIFASDLDSLLVEHAGEDSRSEPVILAEETVAVDRKTAEPPLSRSWYRKRHWRITAMAALVMMVISAGLYGLVRSPNKGPQPVVLTFAVPHPHSQKAKTNDYGKTDVAMPGFVVLASDDNSGFTCVTADLFLDFSDTTMAGMVKDNEAFVRNIIYGAISKALVSPDREKLNKISMGLSVREALGTVVPRDTIRAVFFDKFKII
jgi:hypothetical protein